MPRYPTGAAYVINLAWRFLEFKFLLIFQVFYLQIVRLFLPLQFRIAFVRQGSQEHLGGFFGIIGQSCVLDPDIAEDLGHELQRRKARLKGVLLHCLHDLKGGGGGEELAHTGRGSAIKVMARLTKFPLIESCSGECPRDGNLTQKEGDGKECRSR